MLVSQHPMTSDLVHRAMTVCHPHPTCISSLLGHLHCLGHFASNSQTASVQLYGTYYQVPFSEEHFAIDDEYPHSLLHYPQRESLSLHHYLPPMMRVDPEIPVSDAYLP